MRVKIAPSILSADFARLGEQVLEVAEGGAAMIHVDVMDGHFVPNLSMGPIVVEALRRVSALPLDVHLMITEPRRYAEAFVRAGARHISFHLEVESDPAGLARVLREQGVGAGIVVNPETSIDGVLGQLAEFDMVLVMTVHPGFGGQSFLAENLEKVRAVRARERELRERGILTRPLEVEVDGGIDLKTSLLAVQAGADVLVAGSAIFSTPSPADTVRRMRENLEAVISGS